MAYIGRQPTFGDFSKVDVSSWTFNASTTAFPLGKQVGNGNQLIVSLNGARHLFIMNDGYRFSHTLSSLSITFCLVVLIDFKYSFSS